MTGGEQRTRTEPLACPFRANEFSGLPTGPSCRRQAAGPPLSDARTRPGTARRRSGSGSATGHAERADRSSRDTAAFAHGVGPAGVDFGHAPRRRRSNHRRPATQTRRG